MTEVMEGADPDTDVFVTRSFAAPRELVWRFWTEPARLASWFGPPGVTVAPSSVVVELQEGGRWELTMTDEQSGTEHPVSGRILSFRAPEFLEIAMTAETAAGPADVLLRVTFHDHGDRTRTTLHQGPFDPAVRDLTRAGWYLSLQQLSLLLEGNVHE
jgi:uncharacterized protein YndB with AHSA1/START domain